MRIAIANLLDAQRLQQLRDMLARGTWQDGRATAGAAARTVKNNLQLSKASAGYAAAVSLVDSALGDDEIFQSAALPRTMSQPLFARYEAGMGYGPHIDNALMRAPAMRSDLAYTLFISAPADYVGGELVLMDAEGENSIKLEAGTLFLYPATTLHRVDTVSSGRREVCVGWVQSLVADSRVREILFDLARAKPLLSGEARDLVAKSLSNMLRLHAEP